jgi:hypothetical protein
VRVSIRQRVHIECTTELAIGWGRYTAVGGHDGGEENVQQLMWQLILCDEHSHEHRPIRRDVELRVF